MIENSRFLEWTDADGSAKRWDLSGHEVVLGRKPSSDLVFTQAFISGHHAKLLDGEEGLVLVDLESTNGTFLNGQRIQREKLRSGDRIGLGELEITIQLGGAPPPAAPAAAKASLPDLETIMPTDRGHSDLEKISLILDLQYQWNEKLSTDHMLRQILKNALQISGAERSFILLRKGTEFDYAAGLDAEQNLLPEEQFRTSRTVVRTVAETRQAVFHTEGMDDALASADSIQALKLRSIACLPLLGHADDQEEVLGILYLDSTRAMHALSGLDEKLLGKLAEEAAHILEKLEMVQELEEKRRIELELSLAHETQQALLPRTLPEVPGLVVRAHNQPTRYVGGDFYDFVNLETELFGILADVSGKGIAASILGSSLQGALQMLLRSNFELPELMRRVNSYLCRRSEATRFVTMFLFGVHPDGSGSYVNAGHNPPLIYRNAEAKVEWLGVGDMILGAFEEAEHGLKSFELGPGDILLVYSDGLTEAQNLAEEFFGEERLEQLVSEHATKGAKELERVLLEAVEEFAMGADQADDITLIVLERREELEP